MPDFPRYELLSVTPLEPDRPGYVRVLLACDCGRDTDLTYPADHARETGRSYTCRGCGSSHWFTVTAEGDGDD